MRLKYPDTPVMLLKKWERMKNGPHLDEYFTSIAGYTVDHEPVWEKHGVWGVPHPYDAPTNDSVYRWWGCDLRYVEKRMRLKKFWSLWRVKDSRER